MMDLLAGVIAVAVLIAGVTAVVAAVLRFIVFPIFDLFFGEGL